MRTVAKIFLLFSVVSALELVLLIQIARHSHWLVSLLLVLGPGLAGAWLVRREGARVLAALRGGGLVSGDPARVMIDGLLVLLAGVLLMSPGVLTDLAGLLLLAPPVRRRAAALVGARVARFLAARASGGFGRGGASAVFTHDLGRDGGGYEVIDAEDIPKRPAN